MEGRTRAVRADLTVANCVPVSCTITPHILNKDKGCYDSRPEGKKCHENG